jgi:putative hydrolase of the HAD superfamily
VLRAVTFDLTGTLIHSPRLGEIYSEVLARHGVEVAPVRVARLVGEVWRELDCTVHPSRDRFAAHPGGARGWWRRLLERLCERLEAPAPSPFAAAELFERFAGAGAWEIYPRVDELLVELRRMNLTLGLISNWDDRLPRLLTGLGLAPLFDAVVYSQEVGVEKPHRRIFTAALDRLGLPPTRVLHVGDRRRRDVEGAQAVGMHALLLDRQGTLGDLCDLCQLPARVSTGRW